jgi:hypothetical protein
MNICSGAKQVKPTGNWSQYRPELHRFSGLSVPQTATDGDAGEFMTGSQFRFVAFLKK